MSRRPVTASTLLPPAYITMSAEGALEKLDIVLLDNLTASVSVVTASAIKLVAHVVVMQSRTAKGVVRVRDESDRLAAEMSRVQQARNTYTRALIRRLDDKMLAERAEEADANALLLDAVTAMSELSLLRARADVFELGLDSLQLSFMTCVCKPRELLLAACGVSRMIVSEWAFVWRDGIDASMCEVSGFGMVGFAPGVASHIRVIIRVASDDIAEFVAVTDFNVIVDGGSAVVSLDESGSFVVSYTVDADLRETVVTIMVCDLIVWKGTVTSKAQALAEVKAANVAIRDACLVRSCFA